MIDYPEIKRTLTITGGGLKRDPWKISSSECIDGAEYIMLKCSDSGFNRFVTGKAKSCGPYLKELRAARNRVLLIGENEVTRPKLNEYRRKLLAKQRSEGNTVELQLPAVTCSMLELSAPECCMRVKNSTDLNAAIVVELTAENLHYVRVAALHAMEQGEEQRSEPLRKRPLVKAPPGCRYVKRRNTMGFIACKDVQDTDGPEQHEGHPAQGRKYKWLPFDNSSDMMAADDAGGKASRWINGDDGSDVACNASEDGDIDENDAS